MTASTADLADDHEQEAGRPRLNGRIVRDVARAEIAMRYARLVPSGRHPMYCKPSREELAGDVARKQGPRTDGKVIYPNKEAAEAAARELEALGSRPQRSYECKRSSRGHHHLTTDGPAYRSQTRSDATLPSTVAVNEDSDERQDRRKPA